MEAPPGSGFDDSSTVTIDYVVDSTASVSRNGLELWLRSDDIFVERDSGVVTVWKDVSGKGNDAKQNTPAQQPAYLTTDSDIAGLPSISFDGSNDNLAIADTAGLASTQQTVKPRSTEALLCKVT